MVFKRVADIATQGKNYMIKYSEEDVEVRKTFEADLRRNGAPLKMPPLEELVRGACGA